MGGAPIPEDVKQGQVGDCWLMATLEALARSDKNKKIIMGMISPHKAAAEYTVTFSDGKNHVTAYFPVQLERGEAKFLYALGGWRVPSPGSIALWPSIIEKAYAIMLGNDYGEIVGSKNSNNANIRGAFDKILGKNVQNTIESPIDWKNIQNN